MDWKWYEMTKDFPVLMQNSNDEDRGLSNVYMYTHNIHKNLDIYLLLFH